MSRAKAAVVTTTAYLIIYVSLVSLGKFEVPFYMLLLAPVLIIWMVYSVLRDSFKYPELKDGDEWGYRDIAKENLDTF